MANFSIISDVSVSILKMLREHLCPEPIQSPESVKLAAPSDKNADFQLGVFLYDIRELSEYRSSAPVRSVGNTITYPSKPLTLCYMLFLNSKAQIAAGAEAEQRILGCAIQSLTDHTLVDISAAHSFEGQPDENASITFPNLSFEDKSKIWSALNIPYQVGVYFTVSPVMMSSTRSTRIVRVTETQTTVDPR